MLSRRHLRLAFACIAAGIVGIGVLLWLHNTRITEAFNTSSGSFGTSGPFVTFVIPSIGRDTIDRSLRSLLAQTDGAWDAIVVYDGIEDKAPTIQDPRIRIVRAAKVGLAGKTRNAAVSHIRPGVSWVAFLDDDDAVSPDYVEKLRQYGSDVDVVVFHLRHPSGQVIPTSGNGETLRVGFVGISFAVRPAVFSAVPFGERKEAEDFQYLKDAKAVGKTIVLSEYLTYAVRPTDAEVESADFWRSFREYKDRRETIRAVEGD